MSKRTQRRTKHAMKIMYVGLGVLITVMMVVSLVLAATQNAPVK